MYKAKKKRAVDPNAPPRPTLLGHEKVIKNANEQIAQLSQQLTDVKYKVRELERKLANQTAYLNELHSTISRITQRK